MDSLIRNYDIGTNMEMLKQTYIAENKFIPPLVQVLDSIGPQANKSQVNSKDISTSLDALFPEQKRQDKDIQKAKEILGDLAKNFSDSELKCLLTDIKFLIENWLDDFERGAFNGLTLAELLHERGGI